MNENKTVVPELTDDEIVKVLHSLGIDTHPSKYSFDALQVSGTSVPMIREIVKAYISAATTVTADASLCLAQQDEREIHQVYDLIGLHHSQPIHVLMANLSNMKRFAEMLHAVEREFFMVPGKPDEDYPDAEPDDECLVNSWGSTQEQYIEQFRAALTASSEATAPQDAQERDKAHEWTSVTKRLPIYGEDRRVVIYTEGYDFGGEQFFHIKADSLIDAGSEFAVGKDCEVAEHASHWIYAEDLAALTTAQPADASLRLADKPEGKAEQQAEPFGYVLVVGYQTPDTPMGPSEWDEEVQFFFPEDITDDVKVKATPVFAHPPVQPQGPIKDHVIAQTVNQLRDIAIEFHATQQLRARIAEVIVPLLSRQSGEEPIAAAPGQDEGRMG